MNAAGAGGERFGERHRSTAMKHSVILDRALVHGHGGADRIGGQVGDLNAESVDQRAKLRISDLFPESLDIGFRSAVAHSSPPGIPPPVRAFTALDLAGGAGAAAGAGTEAAAPSAASAAAFSAAAFFSPSSLFFAAF